MTPKPKLNLEVFGMLKLTWESFLKTLLNFFAARLLTGDSKGEIGGEICGEIIYYCTRTLLALSLSCRQFLVDYWNSLERSSILSMKPSYQCRSPTNARLRGAPFESVRNDMILDASCDSYSFI